MKEAQGWPSRPRRRHWLRLIGGSSVLTVLLLAAYWAYTSVSIERRLHRAMAEASRTDPEWQLRDLEAARVVPPGGQNAAFLVLMARERLPPDWSNPVLDGRVGETPPNQLLDPQTYAELRAGLEWAEPAVTVARTLIGSTSGRYPVKWSPDYISTILICQEARAITHLLAFDAALRAEEEDHDGALQSCQAALAASRSVGDEPTLISQLVRLSTRRVTVHVAERCLGMGEASDSALLALQEDLARDGEDVLHAIGLRGERACLDLYLEWLQREKGSLTNLAKATMGSRSGIRDSMSVLGSSNPVLNRACLLENMNEAVAITRLPIAAQGKRFAELQARAEAEDFAASVLIPAFVRILVSSQIDQAELRAMVAAIAAERYRKATGSWPERLTDLVPVYLKAVPEDPFDGSAMRFVRRENEIVIYSVGPDEIDNQGECSPDRFPAAGMDVGIRVWHLSNRRQRAIENAE